jgi:uncharacterized membrane protein YidH (DUF202 family)
MFDTELPKRYFDASSLSKIFGPYPPILPFFWILLLPNQLEVAMTLSFPCAGNPWLIRGIFITLGLCLVGFVPLFGRYATETCSPSFFAFPCFGWAATMLASLAFGLTLSYLGIESRYPWRRIRHWLDGDGILIVMMLICVFSFGTIAFLLKDSAVDRCFENPVLSCLFYGLLDFIFWLLTIVFVAGLYFAVLHHPILRIIGGKDYQRREEDY